MEFTYKRKHNESYMVADLNEEFDSYETRMIEENRINGLLSINKMSLNGTTQYNYNISRKINLEDFLESTDLDIDTLQKFILGLQLGLDEIGKYLIDERHICLDKNAVFVEKTMDSIKVNLCYYPTNNGSVQEQFRELMEHILTMIPSNNRELTELVCRAYDQCLKNDYTLTEILEMFQNIEADKHEIYVEKVELDEEDEDYYESSCGRMEEVCMDDYLTDYYQEDAKNNFFESLLGIAKRIGKKRREESVSINEDFCIDPTYEINERTVLLSEAKVVGKLIYDGRSGEDDFIINKDLFRIGAGSNNDMILRANTVSNSHAKIVREEDGYYIMDCNSLNGTTVNDTTLCYQQRLKLKAMDKIAFATERYIFM